jgi:uncharacterized membrane protein (DUF4010 family)
MIEQLFELGNASMWISLAIALLIGLLIGAERESSRSNVHVGLRDFLVISAIAFTCALINVWWLTAIVSLGLSGVMIAHHMREPYEAGITTEMAMIVTFVLSYLVSIPGADQFDGIGIALAIIVVLFLDAKPGVKKFFREVITDRELADTVRFLALIFIILPLLPDGRYGPYGFLAPRSLWIAVIAASGVSFVGYFLAKFLGHRKGEMILAVVGSLVSTTVMTQTYARRVAADPASLASSWKFATLANSIQFIRLAALIAITAPQLLPDVAPALLAAAAAGVLLSIFLSGSDGTSSADVAQVANPLRVMPALQFALFMAVVSFVGNAATALMGQQGLLITGAVGALVDVDAIVLTVADRVTIGVLAETQGVVVVVVAIAMNMLVKLILAVTSGSLSFALRLLASFLAMIVAALVAMAIVGAV